jgi:MOSC domain-containing protein YiiM
VARSQEARRRGVVLSVQVGRPAPLPWRGRAISTAIVKTPVDGPRRLTRDGFEGDEQADLTVHGGPDKAACAYASEHIPAWQERLGTELPPGAFGENLTLRGILEPEVHIGDVFGLGTARGQVSQPRGPCFKLAARWGEKALPAEMARAGVSGWYFRVLEEGEVQAGDGLDLVDRSTDVPVTEVMRVGYRHDGPAIRRLLETPHLAEEWKAAIRQLAAAKMLPLRDFGG